MARYCPNLNYSLLTQSRPAPGGINSDAEVPKGKEISEFLGELCVSAILNIIKLSQYR